MLQEREREQAQCQYEQKADHRTIREQATWPDRSRADHFGRGDQGMDTSNPRIGVIVTSDAQQEHPSRHGHRRVRPAATLVRNSEHDTPVARSFTTGWQRDLNPLGRLAASP